MDVLPTLTRKAVEFVTQAGEAGQPFFLYLPLNSPHTPIVPSKEWQGKSGLGSYGDFVMQTDWAVGQVLAAIDQAGVGRQHPRHHDQRQRLLAGRPHSRFAGQGTFPERRLSRDEGGHF